MRLGGRGLLYESDRFVSLGCAVSPLVHEVAVAFDQLRGRCLKLVLAHAIETVVVELLCELVPDGIDRPPVGIVYGGVGPQSMVAEAQLPPDQDVHRVSPIKPSDDHSAHLDRSPRAFEAGSRLRRPIVEGTRVHPTAHSPPPFQHLNLGWGLSEVVERSGVLLEQAVELPCTPKPRHARADDDNLSPLPRRRLTTPCFRLLRLDLDATKVDITAPHKPVVADVSDVKPPAVLGAPDSLVAVYSDAGAPHPQPQDAISDIQVCSDLCMADMVAQHGVFLLV